jgi:hypothetical protein
VRSRGYGKDIVIVMLVLALLALLVWLFLRPGQQARDIVFGDLGRQTALTNGLVGGAVAGTNQGNGERGTVQSLGAVGGGSTAAPIQPEAALSTSEQLTTNQRTSNAVPGNSQRARDVASVPGGPQSGPSASFSESGSSLPVPSPNPAGAPAHENIHSRSLSPSSSQASPATSDPATSLAQASAAASAAPLSPQPPPTPPANSSSTASSFELHTKSAPYVDPLPLDPANKDRTVELLATARAATAPTLPRTADLLGNNGGPAPLFDAQAGSNVVFILDNSMNMKTNDKSLFARQELARTLQSMKAGQTFYVLLFHSGGYEGMPSLAPVPATLENVRAMTNWLFSVGHRTGADPTKAMQRGLGLTPAPDTVWLLSGSEVLDKFVDNIRDANGFVNAHINTIGFYTRDNEQGLRQIADENRGAYRFVPPSNLSPP